MKQEMDPEKIAEKALHREFLTPEEGQVLFERLSLTELMLIGYEIRKSLHPGNQVTWIIDRNVNITNVCLSG
ncbi:MAG TPA: dehypoxanthine futalosine cyclase, partial [Bacteroidales bacterium]|nr:dehypoxanthine futalosine cyclase [Bacteroidales bacterium]